MSKNKFINTWSKRFSFRGLSIQQRLPLLICILLCSVILSFSFASYYGVKKASLEMGKKRVRSLTDQLGTMLSESSKAMNTSTLAVVQKDTVKKYVQSRGTEFRSETLEMLNKLRKDSTWCLVELLDLSKTPILRSGDEKVEAKLSLDTIFSSLTVGPDSCKAGKIYVIGDSMYYPVVATVTDKKQIIGYLVTWRSLSSTPKGLEQLSQLMGTGATLYIGNTGGSFWTNLIKPVPSPPIDTQHIQNIFEYTNQGGKRVIAAVQPITNTQWWVLVELSEQTILETSTSFLHWISIIGGILIAVGIFIAWLMSRNITRPLHKLTEAASAIAGGNYSSLVEVDRSDELGKLARAFNIMAVQVRNAQQDMEGKIIERTAELETANKELESFSYSVSHDLRAPLRAVNGYAQMLHEDYGTKLDEEGKRIIETIRNNAIKMGTLIDELLAFSQLGRKEVQRTKINMNELVESVLIDMDKSFAHKAEIKIGKLHQMEADYGLLRQVMLNLISNALKYSSKKEHPIIEIFSEEKQGEIVFSVKDNGAGFDMKYYDKLFGVFQRLHKQNEFVGLGVGLAIVQRVITKHAGKVWAEGKVNEGATFNFSLTIT
ncbi:MAG: HAMP domain-containing protein [Flavobacteriaceae bacterium]|nr:HAMP domain-containing protein [Flavobacteriaceae bacterium]